MADKKVTVHLIGGSSVDETITIGDTNPLNDLKDKVKILSKDGVYRTNKNGVMEFIPYHRIERISIEASELPEA